MTLLESNVRYGIVYNDGDEEKIGTLNLPDEDDVRDGILYDNNTKEGTLDIPIENYVAQGFNYDNNRKTGTLIAPIGGGDPYKCSVWGYIYNVNGYGKEDVKVSARLKIPNNYTTTTQISVEKLSTTTDGNGYWTLSLIESESLREGVLYEFSFDDGEDFFLVEEREVPRQASSSYGNLMATI